MGEGRWSLGTNNLLPSKDIVTTGIKWFQCTHQLKIEHILNVPKNVNKMLLLRTSWLYSKHFWSCDLNGPTCIHQASVEKHPRYIGKLGTFKMSPVEIEHIQNVPAKQRTLWSNFKCIGQAHWKNILGYILSDFWWSTFCSNEFKTFKISSTWNQWVHFDHMMPVIPM